MTEKNDREFEIQNENEILQRLHSVFELELDYASVFAFHDRFKDDKHLFHFIANCNRCGFDSFSDPTKFINLN